MEKHNNTPQKWTKDEEKKLLISLSAGKTLDKIAAEHSRSVNALELRLKKIVYDNITGGKTEASLSNILKIQQDKIKQYYYEYKSFLEKKSKSIDSQLKIPQTEITAKHMGGNNELPKPAEHTKEPREQNEVSHKQNEEMSKETILKVFNHIKKMGKQNKILKNIVENAELKEKIKSLAEKGLIKKEILDYFKIK